MLIQMAMEQAIPRKSSGMATPVVKQINTLKILHANVNCSNFETSKNFYMMLGFTPLIETDVDVSDPQRRPPA